MREGFSDKIILDEYYALLTGRWMTDLANTSAYIFHSLPSLNWVGFYIDDGQHLRLGPFQGKVACTDISYDRGVCGEAFRTNKILNVPDVQKFANHIICDTDSKSEVVIPFLLKNCAITGVLDLDSPNFNRFQAEDVATLSALVTALEKKFRDE